MLPFAREILDALLGDYNLGLWPVQPALALVGLAMLSLCFIRFGGSDRLIAAALAAAWIWVGLVWHLEHFAPINFAAPVYAGLFLIEAVFLAWAGLIRRRLTFARTPGPATWVGVALALCGLVLLPIGHALAGPGWPAVPTVGLSPGPTALFTLGLLLMARPRTPVHLAAIPVMWCLVAGASAWPLGLYPDLLQPVGAVAALGVILWRKRVGTR